MKFLLRASLFDPKVRPKRRAAKTVLFGAQAFSGKPEVFVARLFLRQFGETKEARGKKSVIRRADFLEKQCNFNVPRERLKSE